MKRLSLFLFAALLAVVSTFAQVTHSVSYKRVSPSQIDVIFTIKADAGWHVYGTKPVQDGPTPATFHIDSAKGVKTKGALKGGPGLKTHYEEMFEANVNFYEGTATFTQSLEITDKNYSFEGYMQFGACNDENCLPPTNIDCKVGGADGPDKNAAAPAPAEPSTPDKNAAAPGAAVTPDAAAPAQPDAAADAAAEALADAAAQPDAAADAAEPGADAAEASDSTAAAAATITEAPAADENSTEGKSLWYIFGMGFLGGLLALVTPCVWPIIPMTVSFFLKRAKDDRKKGIRDAVTYGVSIVVIYVALGLLVTIAFGASALNDLATNAFFNIFFFLMLVVFAASFLGGFEITLPSSWTSKVDSKAEATTGLLSIFLMAFTLCLVSFSCTGPIIGGLLVVASTAGGDKLAPTIGMLAFALALAIPFTFFALFPSLLKKTSRGGNWMNQIKVVLGLLELAFAFKFFSVADLAYGWHLLDREVFLSIWIVIFATLAFYLFGWLRFPHDEYDPEEGTKTSVPAYFIGLASLAFAIYMIPGLWGAPCKAVSAFAPPMNTQDFILTPGAESAEGGAKKGGHVEAKFRNYEEALAYAKEQGKPLMVDFTGFGCVNCRKMEAAVWTNDEVRRYLTDEYVLVSLFVDEKTPLPEMEIVQENGQETKLRTIGDKWSYLQRSRFGSQTQPYYVLLDTDGNLLVPGRSYNEDIPEYVKFLQSGLDKFAAK